MEHKTKEMHFFKEKKWIMAWWFKKNNSNFSENQMLIQWNRWWKTDFTSIDDEKFQNAFNWVKDTVNTMTMDEIKKKRYDIADRTSIPSYINKLAKKKGCFVKKSGTSKHPLSVSGYAIFKKKNGRKAICGRKFDLTVKQVREYLEQLPENKSEGKEA